MTDDLLAGLDPRFVDSLAGGMAGEYAPSQPVAGLRYATVDSIDTATNLLRLSNGDLVDWCQHVTAAQGVRVAVLRDGAGRELAIGALRAVTD